MCVGVLPDVCLCSICVQYTQKPRWISGTGVTRGYDPPCGHWKLNSGPLTEQPVLLTAEPSVQPPTHHAPPPACPRDYYHHCLYSHRVWTRYILLRLMWEQLVTNWWRCLERCGTFKRLEASFDSCICKEPPFPSPPLSPPPTFLLLLSLLTLQVPCCHPHLAHGPLLILDHPPPIPRLYCHGASKLDHPKHFP